MNLNYTLKNIKLDSSDSELESELTENQSTNNQLSEQLLEAPLSDENLRQQQKLLDQKIQDQRLLEEQKLLVQQKLLEDKFFYQNFSRKTYVQTCSSDYITGPQLEQFVGIASYHFGDNKNDCYISYLKAPDEWLFDPREPDESEGENSDTGNETSDIIYKKFTDLPNKRKYFTNVKIGPNPKEFYGEIDWTVDKVSVGGTKKWVYHFTLDLDFAHITNGKCYMYAGCPVVPVGTHEFGVQLKYQIYIKPCFTYAG